MQRRNSAPTKKDILTTAQAANLLGISVRTAQLLIESGALSSWKTPGGHRRVYRADILSLRSGVSAPSASSSAIVILVASSLHLRRYQKILEEIGEAFVEGYSDPYSASFAIGSRLPSVVVIDLEEGHPERLSLLRSLRSNPELGHTHIIAVGSRHTAMIGLQGASRGVPRDSGAEAFVRRPELLPDAVRAILRDAAGATVPIEGPTPFPLAPNEGQRLAALKRSGLVDTPPEEAFDRLTWLAGQSLKTPIALLTLLTPTRQWFKSRYGLAIAETPRSWAFCNRTILQKDVFSVKNLALNAEFAKNPAVSGGPAFRFYAGAPVTDSDGFALGSLCVIDHRPRTLDENQLRSLRVLAGLASDEVRLRAANRQLRWTREALRRDQGQSAGSW
ncbi:MAG TPA: excisionase family DNA-binding protein [Acetobacteraceae bacterium]|nr:excisionase family DNA-binding protein [Acetobacteraceae bacterium]